MSSIDFTFGIITSGGQEKQINKIIDSIESQNIPHYEIIIIGDCRVNRNYTVIKPFDETVKKGWITRKKNIITYYALYENIVYLHDYIYLDKDWYQGFLRFGNNFDIVSGPQLDAENKRWVDWSLWWEDVRFLPPELGAKIQYERKFLLPYNVSGLTKYMYIGGTYWVAKKHIMKEFPLDESLCHGGGEDVFWSQNVRQKYNFSCNADSIVHFMKAKSNPFLDCPAEIIEILKGYCDGYSHIPLKESQEVNEENSNIHPSS